jgi:hypothetical protein
LNHLAQINSQASKLSFYIYAIQNNTNTPESTASFAWTLTPTNISFAAQITYWPSTTRAYLVGIISILSVAPPDSQITILTSHSTTIKTINSILQIVPNLNLSLQKQNSWPLKQLIHTIIARKNITIKLTLINAKSKPPLFQHTIQTVTSKQYNKLELIPHALDHNNFFISWNNTIIEHKTRRFIRHIQNANNIARWHSLNRAQTWNQLRQNTD